MSVNEFNSIGYHDPTVFEALTNIEKEEKEAARKAAYRPLVFVCSSYAGETEINVSNACKFSRFTAEQNGIPVTPHLLYPQFMNDTNATERSLAMHFNYVLLGKCKELWVFGGTVSKGMAREIDIANKRRMKIRWFNNEMREVAAYA